MINFLQELISPANLAVTVLMGLVLCYWLMVICGVLGMDVFDLELDADADLDLDGGVDADADGSIFSDALHFMHLGDVPVMIVASIFVFVFWMLTITMNHYLNQDATIAVSFLWMAPNIVLSLLATKIVLMPLVTVFKHRESKAVTHENLIGLAGVVKTSEVNEQFGQIEIRIDGPPIVVNVRTQAGHHLAKGDLAKIVSYNNSNDTFTVELSKWEKE